MPSSIMGNSAGKANRARRKNENRSEDQDKKDDQWVVGPEGESENRRFLEMKRLVREEPNVFILNNLLMSLQLFTNFDEEMEKARESVKAREEHLNEKLIPDKNVLMPDVLREHFKGKIRFTSFCKDEQTVEPLKPIQMYVVYGNVIVTELEDSRDYSTTGDVSVEYTFVLKEADHKGYVRLEQPNKGIIKRNALSQASDLSSIVESRDGLDSEDESVYGPTNGATSMPNLLDEQIYQEARNAGFASRRKDAIRPRWRKVASSASSSSSGYATNYSLDSDSESNLSQSRLHPSEIPERCYKRVTYMFNGRVYNPRKEQKPLTSQQRRIREEKLAYNYEVVYVNACRFAKHFHGLLRGQLAQQLGFDDKELQSAKRCEATLRLEKIDYLNTKNHVSIEQYEVIPCFASHWPQWARRWMTRPRGNWPSEEALERIQRYNCYLLPESARLATPDAQFWQLDWSLAFPRAEQHLESCLSGPQLTVYTVVLMIHKIFIRTVSSTFGLDTRHLRNMLFWMVEKQPEWSEHELGRLTLTLLERLHKHVQLRKMSDFFMEERNVLGNVNSDGLLHSQKQLKRIIDNPVMFVFHAMEKIHYENEQQYPRLDYAKLLRLLTVNELLLISPALESHIQEEAYKKPQVDKKFWNQAKQTNQYYMQTRKTSAHTSFSINPTRISDTIIEIQERCESLTSTRLSHLLVFFAEHFLQMAQCCHNFGAAHQKRVYLEQTRLLALLLFENPDYRQNARDLVEAVNQLRALDVLVTPSNLGPETPRRNVDQPIFAGPLRDRFTHGRPSTVIEETETNNNNNNVIQVDVHKSALKRLPSDLSANGEESTSAETTVF